MSVGKTSEELYKEREKRIFDAIQLKVPDRVPISAFGSFFSAQYYGYTCREVMTEAEYDEYLFDPTDFVIRKVWPRIFDTLKPFEKLPPLQTVTDYMAVSTFVAFAEPAMQKALEAMVNTGKIVQQTFGAAMAFDQKLVALGFPILMGGG